jgi:hypothetical protein
VDISISVDAEPAVRISTATELEKVIRLASQEARARKNS